MIFGKTGERCLIGGKYRCFGNDNQRIIIDTDDIFPKPNNDHEGIWILIARKEEQADDCNELYELASRVN